MSEEQVIIDDFEERTRGSWTSFADYDTVTALLLYWVEDDLNVKSEVVRLESLLKDDFGFSTTTVRIPSKSPKAELQYQLATFVKQYSLDKKSLSIVYYAGHADNADDKAPAGYSEWRAMEQGGPSVNWFEIQPSLYAAEGDVLILLDCCHAALKTRGAKNGKMEVLAASASGSRVPAPGRISFTSVLIRQIRKQLQVRRGISVRWLHKHLWDDTTYPSLTQTPVYFDLSENDERSIILTPLLPKPPEGFARRKATPSAFMMLTVSLADDPTGLQIANWLKSFPPSIIQDVEIEGLVLKARRLEELKNINALFTGSILGRISRPAQIEITERLSVLSGVVSSAATLAAAAAGRPMSIDMGSNSGHTERVINELQTNVSAICDTIEDNLLLGTNLELKEAAKDEVTIAVEATQAINLRQYLLDSSTIPDQPEIPREAIRFCLNSRPGAKKRFRYGFIAEKPVIVETFQYELPKAKSSEPRRSADQQIKRMVNQLSQAKRTSFHILPCIGYFQARNDTQFSVVFQIEDSFAIEETPTTLRSLYSSTKRVPLGERIRLAYAMAVAVENLHRVGWLHKELKSDNVLFFKTLEQGKGKELSDVADMPGLSINFALPWLFGFEYSRAEDTDTYLESDYSIENNAYRHPERWGKPRVKFERSHDVYALGVILLEIALWKQVQHFPELKNPKDPWVIKEALLSRNKKDLPHMVGQNFSNAIAACFQFKELTTGFNELETQRVLREKIIGRMQKAVGNV